MRFFTRGAAIAAVVGFPGLCQAYVLIDDFTVGEYHAVINWPFNFDSHQEAGLDANHCGFGFRATNLRVLTNQEHASIAFDIGSGYERVSYPSHNVATQLYTIFGGVGFNVLDFSNETEFWVDEYTEQPFNRFADKWIMYASDTAGHNGTSGSFLLRNGGIYFKKSAFSGGLDWSQIRSLEFDQEFTPDIGQVPLAYNVTRIYAVPEAQQPLTLAGAAALCWRRARRVAGVRRVTTWWGGRVRAGRLPLSRMSLVGPCPVRQRRTSTSPCRPRTSLEALRTMRRSTTGSPRCACRARPPQG